MNHLPQVKHTLGSFMAIPHLWLWVVLAILVGMIVLSIIGRKQYRWTITDTGQSELSSLREPYWLRVLVAFDVFCNVVAFGLPNECISSRCGRWGTRPHGHLVQRFILSWLDVIQADHGWQSISGDLGRAQRVVKIESEALAKVQVPQPADSGHPTPV